MKKLPFLIVMLLLVTCVPDASADSEHVRLTGMLPTSSFEGVEITNYGDAIDLRDYSLYDGEGTVSFSSSFILEKNQSVWILKGEPADWFAPENYLVIGTNGITSSKYALADKGDDVYLMHNGAMIDAFVYGEMEKTYNGWDGEPFEQLSKNSYAKRTSYFDTDSANDWIVKIPGREEVVEFEEYECAVETFVFPESKGYPVLNALKGAEKEVDISIYNLSQNDVVSIILSLLKKDVAVNILCDGSPVGGINESELKALATLADSGASVHLIKQNDDGFRRYTYLHNKYAIIDDSKVIITSENWVDSSFSGNRGWGVIVESEGYAGFMKSIFTKDFDISNSDVSEFRESYKKQKTDKYVSTMEFDYEQVIFDAVVKPVLSPDNSIDAMRELMSNAEYRIYSEQLDVQYSWLTEDDNPLQWMISKGTEGVDCRLLVDTTFDSEDDEDVEDGYGIIEALEDNENIECKKVNGNFSVVHNKGLIVDDSVWIGSVNWTYTSFNSNRESAVIIQSKEVADFYANYFESDWGLNESTIEPKIVVKGEMKENSTFALDASTSIVNSGTVFQWDLDGDGVFERTGTTVMLSLPVGHYTVTLMITDDDGNVVTTEYGFDVTSKVGDGPKFDWKYIPLIGLCAMILLVEAFKKIRARCR